MINYVLYDQDGSIIQQGVSDKQSLRALSLMTPEYKVLEIADKIADINSVKVENGILVAVEKEQISDYAFSRYHDYPSIGHQLDCLYKDIQAGLFGEAAKQGLFCSAIAEVKTKYPKQ
jgi:hypothetical protein